MNGLQHITPVLKARNLKLSWDGILIIDGVSLSLEQGEILCLVGKSGTGKSTIFHALAGLSQPDSGAVYLNGQDITGMPGHVSYMLQKDLLLPNLSVLDNCSLPLVLKGESREKARAQASELLDTFGLSGAENLWPVQLSGGMKQRAAFLRTYLMGSEVMLLDEPFSALDAITRTELREWFVSAVRELGLSVVLVTHDVDEAVFIADRVLVLAGSPQQEVPSQIVGECRIERPGNQSPGSSSFELSPQFLSAKQAVLEMLT